MIDAIDIAGHLGYALVMVGVFLLSRHQVLGWLFRCAGEVVWLVVGVYMGMSSIVVWGVVFVLMDLYGFWSWKTNGLDKPNNPS